MHFHPKWDGLVRPDDSDSAAYGHRSARGMAGASLGDRAADETRPGAHEPHAHETVAAERIARIRQRVREGYYASPEMMSLVAARLLESGEL